MPAEETLAQALQRLERSIGTLSRRQALLYDLIQANHDEARKALVVEAQGLRTEVRSATDALRGEVKALRDEQAYYFGSLEKKLDMLVSHHFAMTAADDEGGPSMSGSTE